VVLILALVFALVFEVGRKALPGMEKHGLTCCSAVSGTLTKASTAFCRRFGARFTALYRAVIAGFFGVSMAIFLTQDFLPARLAAVFRTIVELLAAIPSVVYGLWGIYVVIPAIRPLTSG
jgi:phosphate transport system permease protein